MTVFWDILKGLPTTLLIFLLSLSLGFVGAVPMMLARRSPWLVVRAASHLVINLVRAIPPIVWLFIVFFGLTELGIVLSPFVAAVVGLGAVSCVYLAEILRGGVMAVDKGQWEAASALSLARRDTYRSVIGPQALRVALPGAATYAIGLLKDTTLAYTIGVQEILFRANHEALIGAADPLLILGLVALLYAALSIPTGLLARRLDRALTMKVSR